MYAIHMKIDRGQKRPRSQYIANCNTREEARRFIIHHMNEAYASAMRQIGLVDRKSEENGDTFVLRIIPALIFEKPITITYEIK